MTEPDYAEFSDPRLVALYDTLNPLGDDSELFCRYAAELAADTIIDLGCGTGLLTVELAVRGHRMTGIDPSEAMLALARARPNGDQVKWIRGGFDRMDGLRADMVLMTSHVAQFILDERDWRALLRAAHRTLNEGGHLVFDVRRLSSPPFAGWPTDADRRRVEDTPAGAVEWWLELLGVEDDRVRYALHYHLLSSGDEVVSVNDLVFRSQDEITRALAEAGFTVVGVLGDGYANPATPTSAEMVFVAKRA